MRQVAGFEHLQAPVEGAVVTIGNYDGVHIGHRKILKKVNEISELKNMPSVVVSFSPHPMEVLAPDKPFERLFDVEDTAIQIESLGLDYFLVQPFHRHFASLEAEQFFDQYLNRWLKPSALVVGEDFQFGAGRAGGLQTLKALSEKHGFELEIVPSVRLDGQRVSSTRIRQAVKAGDMDLVQRMLGRPYYVKGLVQKGDQRGRKIGFPTANLRPQQSLILRAGVYFSRSWLGGRSHLSVTNVGFNPTFQESAETIPLRVETHILDFSGDIYARILKVELLKFHRAEQRFSGVADLQIQIEKDIEEARAFFSGQ